MWKFYGFEFGNFEVNGFLSVGRVGCDVIVNDPRISHTQFTLETKIEESADFLSQEKAVSQDNNLLIRSFGLNSMQANGSSQFPMLITSTTEIKILNYYFIVTNQDIEYHMIELQPKVYLQFNLLNNKKQVIKQTSSASAERQLMKIHHPNILQTQWKQTPQKTFLKMPYIAGGDLYDKITKSKGLTEPQSM